MKEERVAEEEIYAAIRGQGIHSLSDVAAVILETDGTFAVLKNGKTGIAQEKTTLKYVDFSG